MRGTDDPGHVRVSVVVPAYNRESLLGDTIASVRCQTFDRWELVVVDDGSTDGTRAVAERHAADDARISVHTYTIGGVARARDRGLDRTDPDAEFVVFLDSDDRWIDDTLAMLVARLDADPQLVAVHGLAACVDASGVPIAGDDLPERKRRRLAQGRDRLVEVPLEAPTPFEAFVVDNWTVTPGTCLIRRSALRRIGRFDPSVEPGDDWDLNIRLSRLGAFGFVDHPVLWWRKHDDTLTNTSARWRHAYHAVRDRAVLHPSNTAAQRSAALGVYRDAVREEWRTVVESIHDRAARRSFAAVLRAGYGSFRYGRTARRARRRVR